MRAVMALLLLAGTAVAQTADMTGEWMEPTGSVVRIDHCGSQLCMWVVTISNKAPSNLDVYNPDPARRSRPLCGLQIGSGFSLRSPGNARDGTVYDPKSSSRVTSSTCAVMLAFRCLAKLRRGPVRTRP